MDGGAEGVRTPDLLNAIQSHMPASIGFRRLGYARRQVESQTPLLPAKTETGLLSWPKHIVMIRVIHQDDDLLKLLQSIKNIGPMESPGA